MTAGGRGDLGLPKPPPTAQGLLDWAFRFHAAVGQILKNAATRSGIAPHDHTSNSQGGVLDHGSLTGLGDDDHPQYVTHEELDAMNGDWLAWAGLR